MSAIGTHTDVNVVCPQLTGYQQLDSSETVYSLIFRHYMYTTEYMCGQKLVVKKYNLHMREMIC